MKVDFSEPAFLVLCAAEPGTGTPSAKAELIDALTREAPHRLDLAVELAVHVLTHKPTLLDADRWSTAPALVRYAPRSGTSGDVCRRPRVVGRSRSGPTDVDGGRWGWRLSSPA